MRIENGVLRLLLFTTAFLNVNLFMICWGVKFASSDPLILFLTIFSRWLWSFWWCNDHCLFVRNAFLKGEKTGQRVSTSWDWLLFGWRRLMNDAAFLSLFFTCWWSKVLTLIYDRVIIKAIVFSRHIFFFSGFTFLENVINLCL